MVDIINSRLLKTGSYIDGHWHENHSTFPVDNPATLENITHVSNADATLATKAVLAAKQAFKTWKQQTAAHRANLLRNWYQLLIDNSDDLATLLTLEQGKPILEAKAEILYGASFIEWFAEEAKRIYGDTIPSSSSDQRILVLKQPVGVVSAITPWNFPNAMIARKAAAALAAGCTFVVKPAMETPLSALAMAELAEQAGIPNGVFNVVVSENAPEIGRVLTTHEDVSKFTFTGSTNVGKKLAEQCASTVKRVSLELGGNAPFIVFDDADIDLAVSGAIAAKYRNAGQTCVCANRILVQKNIAQQFTETYCQKVQQLKIGNGLDIDVSIGPLISSSAITKVDDLVKQAVKQGANLIIGGNIVEKNYYQPTILTDVTNDMAIAQQEIFGPVSPIIEFESEQQAIDMANHTEYGLAAYFYTENIGRMWRVSEALDVGMVGINQGIISNAVAPFGGTKQSGYGREGSKYGLDDYVETKYMCLGNIA